MTRSPTTHPTSDRAAELRRVRRLARKRGAILVEALIVISLLILGFMGLVFFRAYYTKTLVATRLARGSILVYSMTGCGDSNRPAQWIGNRDLARLTAAQPNGGSQPAQSGKTPASASGKAGDVLSRLPGLSGDGGGIMNEMTVSDLTGRVRVRTSDGTFSPERTVFDQQVRARSFVSCGEPIRDGDYGDVLKYITGLFL
jgi:hypothetical protein